MTYSNDAVVLGVGGREHAIAVGLKPYFNEVYVLPGNAGMNKDVKTVNINFSEPEAVIHFLNSVAQPLVVIGQEALLADGWGNTLRNAGFNVFGPNMDGTKLESSKAYSKSFMKKNRIPTADFFVCRSMDACAHALRTFNAPYIIKADGLAAGKGVFIVDDRAEALTICEELLAGKLGDAGKSIVIEENISGWEMSVFVLTDGTDYVILPAVQDHKRLKDGDSGPNTGGMGAYSPVPQATTELMNTIDKTAIKPTIEGLIKEGIQYKGVIFLGFIIDAENKPQVLEYNVRFGDPEAQVLFPATNCNWGELLTACAAGELKTALAGQFSVKPTATVVASSGGYPTTYETGYEIEGIEKASAQPDTFVYSAGINLKNSKMVTAGGRVLSVTASAKTLEAALQKAYQGMNIIKFKAMHYRKDIGKQNSGIV